MALDDGRAGSGPVRWLTAIRARLAAAIAYMASIIAGWAAGYVATEGDASRLAGRSARAAQTWRALVMALPDPAVVLDRGCIILQFNAQAAELFTNLRTGVALSSVNRSPELIEAVDRALAEGKPQVALLVERVPIERRIEATVTQLEGAGASGEPGLVVTFRDLTEQDRLDRMRQDFVANASHELRTPLASLRGFIETLQGPARNDTAARERFLDIMASQATRMTRLIDDLLSLSRIEMNVHLPPRGIVDLNEVAAYVAQTLEPLVGESGTKLTVEPLDVPARVRGERDEIVQVLSNLMQNAIKYGREAGNVRVRIAPEANGIGRARLALSVSDDGPGIASQHLPRLTERFYRVNVASSREKGGTGLGLAIVKHVVNRHRGELKIESKVGVGSTFTVLLDALA